MKDRKFNTREESVEHSLLEYFEAMIPKKYIMETLLPATNQTLDSKPHVTYGEFLRWIGIWFLIATTEGSQRHEFWSVKDVDRFSGAPFRLNDLMARDRFDEILSAITYRKVGTDDDDDDDKPPTYKDQFWEIQKLQEEWNKNMEEQFEPGWINCLDESMSKWIRQYTCPGFIVCPRKP